MLEVYTLFFILQRLTVKTLRTMETLGIGLNAFYIISFSWVYENKAWKVMA